MNCTYFQTLILRLDLMRHSHMRVLKEAYQHAHIHTASVMATVQVSSILDQKWQQLNGSLTAHGHSA